MVVSKGGCVVDGVFAKRPAFASLDAKSVFYILAVLFVPTSGGGGDADRCLLPVLGGLDPCRRLILF
jgi:hypothetical protein